MDGSGLLGGSPPIGVDEEEEAERCRSLKGLSLGGVEGQAHGNKAAPQDGTPDPGSEGPCLPCRLENTCVISGFCSDRRNGFRTPREWMGVGWTDGGGEEEGGHAVPWPGVLGEDSGMPLAMGRVSGTSPGLPRAGGGTELREVPDGLSVHRKGDGGSGDMVVSGPLQKNYSCAVLPAIRSSSGGPVSPPELRDANCSQHAEGGSNRRAASPCCREEEHMANGGVHLTCTPCPLPLRTSGGGQGYDPRPPPPVQDSTIPEPGLPLHTPCPVSPSDGTQPPSPGTSPPSPGSSPPSPGSSPPSPGTILAARPQSLRTCGSTAVSLSCGATPLSPEDGGTLSLEAGRRQSAPDPLPDPSGSFAHTTTPSKRSTIAEFFTRSLFSRKSKEPMVPSQNATGWRLFGKAGPESDAGQQRPLPSGRRKQLEFEPQSTTALILEDRPANLPAKCEEEAQRHKQEYQEMVAGARRREMKEAQRRKRKVKERHRQEESISHAITTWNTQILPHWEDLKGTRRVRELWWQGLPPSVRGRVWSLAIGNDLNITPELYDIFLCRVKDRWRCSSETSSVNDSESDGGASLADRESSLDLIKLDISRTFPSLFIFQKGGPYHDVLHSLLGAYTCYRPDIGYVQGMSFMAAVLILNLEEAQAFITFTNLLNKPCQLTFFRVDHDLMLKYFAAFEVFFEENLPRLFAHFLANNLTPDLYLIDWIFTLYSKALPLDVACRVWDVFCRDGEESLFRTALGLLRLYQDVLLQMDFIHMAQFLTRLPPDLPPHLLFSAMANTHMVSRAGRWVQVFSSLMKDGNKETHGSPALRS